MGKINSRASSGKFIAYPNTYELKDNLIFVYGKCNDLLFYTNIENEEKVKKYNWGKMGNGYSANSKGLLIHRYLTNCPKDKLVDHINRNKKDNRMCNLRIANKSLNAFNCNIKKNNTSGYTGVWYRKDTNKWVAEIKKDGKKKLSECFLSKEEAIKRRKEMEMELYGENK